VTHGRLPSIARRIVTIALLSGLLASIPALVVGMMLIDQPRLRSAIEARVCVPGETITFRSRLSGSGSQRSTHCRGVDGAIGDADVSFAMMGTATWLVWRPLMLVGVLLWSASALVRRPDRDARASGEATDRTSGLTVSGSVGGAPPTAGPRTAADDEVVASLKRLRRLHDEGLIDRHEFEARRRDVLDRI